MSWEAVIPPLTNQSIRHVPNVCNICEGAHYTGLCSSLSEQHIQDKPYHDNLSRYSVPDGLLIIDCDAPSSPIVAVQKFAKGTRFGPMLAPKSYVAPSRPNKFPLIIFNEVWNNDPLLDELGDEIKELFSVRNFYNNYYLDTSDENQCNWMIHVEIAKCSTEQNLMAYQENDQIYYTSTRDIELGDILKVWYSPSYATRLVKNGRILIPNIDREVASPLHMLGRCWTDDGQMMGVGILDQSRNDEDTRTNDLKQGGIDYRLKLQQENANNDVINNNYIKIMPNNSSFVPTSSEITLPPINSIMKTPSPNYNSIIDFDHLIPMSRSDQMLNGIDCIDNYQMNLNEHTTSSDSEKNSPSMMNPYVKNIKFTEMHDNEAQKFTCKTCGRKYITKSNLEKHMRSHDLFMCVICMKMFPNPEELREHDCFKHKTSTKKSLLHCSICWKVLSNAWSLNRHMKIHRANQISGTMINANKTNDTFDDYMMPTASSLHFHETKVATVDEKQVFENILEKSSTQPATIVQSYGILEKNAQDVSWLESSSTQLNATAVVAPTTIQQSTEMPGGTLKYEDDISLRSIDVDLSIDMVQDQNCMDQDMDQASETMSNQPDSHQQQTADEIQINDQTMNPLFTLTSSKFDKCIVCARTFKNPNSLEKHLKNVHTVHIIKPELTTSIKKSSEYRRIVLNKKPIKENVAKALMSKLNKKNLEQQQKVAAEQNLKIISKVKDEDYENKQLSKEDLENNNNNTIIIISNVEISPASSSPITQAYAQFSNSMDSLLPKLVPIRCERREDNENDTDESPKIFVIDKSNEHQSSNANVSHRKVLTSLEEEHHQCPDCEKFFPKKYQLKRHQDIHENLFYFCPFCDRAPVKARSSLRKHFAKDHPEHHETWQTSSFLSSLLRKYEKVKKSIQDTGDNLKKCKREQKEKKEKRPYRKRNRAHASILEMNENFSCFINNDEPLPQGSNSLDMDDHNQHHQIILSNLFLDPITMDEENNLIKYTLAGEDDFIMSTNNENMSTNGHNCSIENYELSEFSNFKSSFDEIQEKLDAELEFNNDQIKWSDELNDDDSMISSPCGSNLSSPETTGKSKVNKKSMH